MDAVESFKQFGEAVGDLLTAYNFDVSFMDLDKSISHEDMKLLQNTIHACDIDLDNKIIRIKSYGYTNCHIGRYFRVGAVIPTVRVRLHSITTPEDYNVADFYIFKKARITGMAPVSCSLLVSNCVVLETHLKYDYQI